VGFVVVDTDVASDLIRGRPTPSILAALAGSTVCVTFVTIGELTEWEITRGWGAKRVDRIRRWIASVPVLGYDDQVARTWGHLTAASRRAGRHAHTNDTWVAACCLTEGLPLATRNVKDYSYLSLHHKLQLLG
jgi:hypothetical protein